MILDQYNKRNLDHYADWFLDSETLQTNKYTDNLYPYEKLFSEFLLKQLALKNRIVFNSSPNYDLADPMGKPGKRMVDFYVKIAQGGVGLITTGSVPVSGFIDPKTIDNKGRSVYTQIINNQSALSGWAELASACQVFSTKIFITLSAGLGKKGLLAQQSPSKGLKSLFQKYPVAAIGGKDLEQNIYYRRISDRKLEQIIANFGQASKLALAAGLDGIMIEGGSGELLSQMSDPQVNTRKMGSFTNYQSFGLEIVRRIRRVNGSEFPIIYSIELDPLNPEIDYLVNLVKAGVDGFLLKFGGKSYPWLAEEARTLPPGYNLEFSNSIRLALREQKLATQDGGDIPIILSGKLDFPDVAEKALLEDVGDFASLNDAIIADPKWPNKVYTGQVDRIRPSINSISTTDRTKPCSVNPSLISGAKKYLEQTDNTTKKIAIVGAGLAGIECAVAAHSKGHEVWLFEQENKIGGKLNRILIPNFRVDLANYLIWQQKRINELMETSPSFNLVLNTIATMSMLDERNFDSIIVADGGKSSSIYMEKSVVEEAIDVLDILDMDFSDKKEGSLLEQLNIVEKNKIIIFGEHPLALDIAYNLVYAYGKQVYLLFEGEEKFALEQNWESLHLLHFLKQKNIEIYYNVALKNIKNDQISFQSTSGSYTLSYDFLFKATGLEPNRELYNLLYKYKIASEIYHIGDSAKPGSFAENVESGYRLGINL